MRRLKLRKYHYFNRFKKGIIKNMRMEKWEMEKRDEMLQELAQLGVDITIKRQYSVGYHPVSIEIKTTPEGYELVNEFIDIELMRLAQEIPTDVLNELSASQKASNSFKSSAPKKQWDNKPKFTPKKSFNKPQQSQGGSKPQGAQGSEKQWSIILQDNNRDKLVEAGYLNEDGEPNFDIADYDTIKEAVGVAMSK